MNTIIKFVGEKTNKAFLTAVETTINTHDDTLQQLIHLAHSNNDNLVIQAPSIKAFKELGNDYEVMSLENVFSTMKNFYQEDEQN